jgi:hypothetical protein
MNTAFKPLSWVLLWSAAGMAAAQAPPASAPSAGSAPAAKETVTQPSKATAQTEAGEPRAETSPGAAAATTPAPAAPAAAAPTAPAPMSRTSSSPPPGAAAGRTTGVPPGTPGQKAPKSADRLELGTATVTGDREQPKVMYIVPWKRSDIGDLSGKPMNSLLDEALAPVDREEFKREVVYYEAVRADAAPNGASNPPAKQGEK